MKKQIFGVLLLAICAGFFACSEEKISTEKKKISREELAEKFRDAITVEIVPPSEGEDPGLKPYLPGPVELPETKYGPDPLTGSYRDFLMIRLNVGGPPALVKAGTAIHADLTFAVPTGMYTYITHLEMHVYLDIEYYGVIKLNTVGGSCPTPLEWYNVSTVGLNINTTNVPLNYNFDVLIYLRGGGVDQLQHWYPSLWYDIAMCRLHYFILQY